MSAPQETPERQIKRHSPALGGMALAVGVVALGFVIFFAYIFLEGDDPEGAETQINGLTGEPVETDG